MKCREKFDIFSTIWEAFLSFILADAVTQFICHLMKHCLNFLS